MEHSGSVLEYFDQTQPIKLVYASPKGRRMGVWRTPDFFVIRDREAGWEEWKTEEELQPLKSRNPSRYFPNAQGGWNCPPGAAYGPDLAEIARHDLYPSAITGEKHTLPEHSPGRDPYRKLELLKERFTELGVEAVRFLDGIVQSRWRGPLQTDRSQLSSVRQEPLVAETRSSQDLRANPDPKAAQAIACRRAASFGAPHCCQARL